VIPVVIRPVQRAADELVALECLRLSDEFADIRDYVLAKGDSLVGYLKGGVEKRVLVAQVAYFEAVGEDLFAYTPDAVYTVRRRLYEVEQAYADRGFVRVSKSMVVNLRFVTQFRPALNGRFLARLRHGEEVLVSRQYAKAVKHAVLGD